ncbi:MAG: hypothetical protein HQK51_04005 [Oligoflexia bacterium]|nr:hypothetical protein [Oligoflexia bacterium]
MNCHHLFPIKIEEDSQGVLRIDRQKYDSLMQSFEHGGRFNSYNREVSIVADIKDYFTEMAILEQGMGFCETPYRADRQIRPFLSLFSPTTNFTSLLETISYNLQKDFLKKIVADFTQRPTKTYHFSHSLLSKRDPVTGKLARDVEVREYDSSKGEWRWSMAFDRKGRAWVDNLIQLTDNDVRSYGTHSKIANIGVLGNKPIEYVSQSYQLNADERQALSYCFDEAEKICIASDELYLKLKKVYTPLMIKNFLWRKDFFDKIKKYSLNDYNEIIEKYPQYCLKLLDPDLSTPLSNLEKSLPKAYHKLETLYPEYFKSVTSISTYDELLSYIKRNPRLNQIYSEEEDNFIKSFSAKKK